MNLLPRLREIFLNPATPIYTLLAIGAGVGVLIGLTLAWALP